MEHSMLTPFIPHFIKSISVSSLGSHLSWISTGAKAFSVTLILYPWISERNKKNRNIIDLKFHKSNALYSRRKLWEERGGAVESLQLQVASNVCDHYRNSDFGIWDSLDACLTSHAWLTSQTKNNIAIKG